MIQHLKWQRWIEKKCHGKKITPDDIYTAFAQHAHSFHLQYAILFRCCWFLFSINTAYSAFFRLLLSHHGKTYPRISPSHLTPHHSVSRRKRIEKTICPKHSSATIVWWGWYAHCSWKMAPSNRSQQQQTILHKLTVSIEFKWLRASKTR